jgi:methylenetetrahydrofolate reductase (NADPH)
MSSSRTPLSLEFFPAKTAEAAAKLRAIRESLYVLEPEFCSVTYGAGGSTHEGTFSTLREMVSEGASAASHLSCIGATRDTVRAQLREIRDMGVRRIVALRGDLPDGQGAGGDLRFASDLVAFIRSEMGDYFSIEVAAYPEVHPQARSASDDLRAFATKAHAGANSAITQYFFNSDAYFRFVEDVEALGVKVPIVPGIMPITNAIQLMRFSDACGAEIPRWIRQRLIEFGDDLNSIRAFGLDVVTDLCDQLIAGGVPALHFYTMNQSSPTMALCERLGLVPAAGSSSHLLRA